MSLKTPTLSWNGANSAVTEDEGSADFAQNTDHENKMIGEGKLMPSFCVLSAPDFVLFRKSFGPKFMLRASRLFIIVR